MLRLILMGLAVFVPIMSYPTRPDSMDDIEYSLAFNRDNSRKSGGRGLDTIGFQIPEVWLKHFGDSKVNPEEIASLNRKIQEVILEDINLLEGESEEPRRRLSIKALDKLGGGHLVGRTMDKIGGGHLLGRSTKCPEGSRQYIWGHINERDITNEDQQCLPFSEIATKESRPTSSIDVPSRWLSKRQLTHVDRLGGGGGHLLRNLERLRLSNLYPRQNRGGQTLDSLSGISFGTNKRLDTLSGVGFGSQKRNFDEIDRSGFNSFIKRNFDEIDRTGFNSFVKKNFDEIDRTGFNSFVKRSTDKEMLTH